MQKNAINGPRLLVTIILIFIFTGMGVFPFEIPKEGYRGASIGFIAFGTYYIFRHKAFAMDACKPTKRFSVFGFDFWEYIGKDRAQFLFLGIGIIMIAYGVFMVIWSLDAVRLFLDLPIIKPT